MTIFYTANDLIMRRVNIARWICSQIHIIEANFKYGELIKEEYLMNFQYVVASLEAMECYTPITSVAEDGESNCLTEAKITSLVNNIEEITGLRFQCAGTTYNPNNYEGVTADYIPVVVNNSGSGAQSNTGVSTANPVKETIPWGNMEADLTIVPVFSFKEIILSRVTDKNQDQYTKYNNLTFEFENLIITKSDYISKDSFYEDLMIKVKVETNTADFTNNWGLDNGLKTYDWTSLKALQNENKNITYYEPKNTVLSTSSSLEYIIGPVLENVKNKVYNTSTATTTAAVGEGFKIVSQEGENSYYPANINAKRTGVYWYVEFTVIAIKLGIEIKMWASAGQLPSIILAKNTLSNVDILNGKGIGQGSITVGDTVDTTLTGILPSGKQPGKGVYYVHKASNTLIEDLKLLQIDQLNNGL